MTESACPFCAGDVPEGSATCPHCGHALAAAPPGEVDPRRPPAGGLGCGMLAVLVALISLILLFGLLAGGLLG